MRLKRLEKSKNKHKLRIETELMEDPTTRRNWTFVRLNLKGLVLDIGCGKGLVTHVHHATIGLDIMYYNDCVIPFVRGDFHHLPFKSLVFDVAVLSHSLEHSPNPYLALQEVYRVLKQDGKILIMSPNAKNFLWPLYLALHRYLYWKDHASFFTYDSLKKLMASVNFEKIKTFSSLLVPPIPFIWIQRIFKQKAVIKAANVLSENYPDRLSCDVIVIGHKYD